MPSPFPGMDPFLENPHLWESFHNRMIGALDATLSARVQPRFYVEQQSAVHIIEPGFPVRPPIKPDVYLVEAGQTAESSSPTAVAERPITAPTIVTVRVPEEIRQRYLEIRDAHSHRVITVIEVFSPANKAAGTPSRRAFMDKRLEVMASPVHWIEIDLLRVGERPEEAAGYSDYYALLKRGGAERFEIWFWNLHDSLPVIAVPLTPPIADLSLDLQALLTTIYDDYYAARLDYNRPLPLPRPSPADLAWIDEQLRARRAENDGV